MEKNQKMKDSRAEEDNVDFDRLDCKKCDRFVESVNKEGLCPECASEEETEKELWENLKQKTQGKSKKNQKNKMKCEVCRLS